MKLLLLTSFLLVQLFNCSAQSTQSFLLNKHDANISFIRMDSAHTSQATVIEYPKFLVVIELPFTDRGADKSTELFEDVATANDFLAFLKEHYHKPVKYVLSSHWHLHSLSAITPFFKEGAQLITAASNWQYSLDHGFLGAVDAKFFSKNIIQIHRDSSILSKTKFPIDIIFLDSTYTHKPTKDYLFFYFPGNRTLHASCMCALSEVDFEKRKGFTYSDRVTDLNHAIASRNLQVNAIIKLGRFEQTEVNYLAPVFSYAYLQNFMKNGQPMQTAVKLYTDLSLRALRQQKDSVLRDAIVRKISPAVINQAVYNMLKTKEYNRAQALAQILNLFKPGDPNYIDTLGEACFAAGDIVSATYYEEILRTKNPTYEGGMKTWEQNKKTIYTELSR